MNTYNIIPRESLRSKRFFIYGNNEKTAYLPSGRGCTMGAAWVHLANQQPKRHNMQTQKRQEHRLEEVCTLLGPRPPVHFKHGCTMHEARAIVHASLYPSSRLWSVTVSHQSACGELDYFYQPPSTRPSRPDSHQSKQPPMRAMSTL